LRVSLDEAEKIKLDLSKPIKDDKDKKESQIEISEEGSGEIRRVQRRTITEGIVRPRLNEIFTMVKLELERNDILNRIPSGVVITGGGSLTYGAVDSAKRILSLPVRLAEPGGVGGLTDDILNPMFSSPIGLLLYAANRNMNNTPGPILRFSKKSKMPDYKVFSKIIDTIKGFLP
jgi:cell division protein FtsA